MAMEIVRSTGNSGGGDAGATSGPAPMVYYEVGGRTYEAKRAPNCHMCAATDINLIETQLMMGYATRTIWESLPETCDLKERRGWDFTNFSKRLSHHRRSGHMPFEAVVSRLQMEQRAVMMNIDLDAIQGSLIDPIGALDTVIQKGTHQVLEGATIKPSVLVGAIRTRTSIAQSQAGAIDNETVAEAFALYLEETRAFMTEDDFNELGLRLNRSPMLRALAERVQRQRDAADLDSRMIEIEAHAEKAVEAKD